MNRWLSRLALVAALALPSVALASPGLIPVQGTLYDTAGEPVSGTLPVTYTLYADAAATVPLWSDTFPTLFTAGIFTAYLGSDSPINLIVFDQYDDVWVGISIDGDPQIGVFRVATAPFAGHADYCNSAAILSPEGTTSVVTAALASADGRYAPLSHRTAWSTIDGIPADLADGDQTLSSTEVIGIATTAGFITQILGDSRYAFASHRTPWSTIDGIPADIADGDRVLTEAEVDAFAGNNGYVTQTAGDSRYALVSHRTPWSTIDGIPADIADGDRVLTEAEVDAHVADNGFITQTTADGRYAAASHTHPWSQITNLPAGFNDDIDNTSSGVRVVPRNCTRYPSTDYWNEYDAPVNFACPGNRMLVGTDSIHSNSTEDRRYAFTCCELFVQ